MAWTKRVSSASIPRSGAMANPAEKKNIHARATESWTPIERPLRFVEITDREPERKWYHPSGSEKQGVCGETFQPAAGIWHINCYESDSSEVDGVASVTQIALL